jgi:hypothetical protein
MIDFDKTIRKSFSIDFCQRLEYHLARAFSNAGNNEFRWIWCDGIEVPDAINQSLENFVDTKEITTGAWLGVTGQDKYKMTIKLGDKSFEELKKGLSLNNCLPSEESLDWVDIDIQNKSIILQLK